MGGKAAAATAAAAVAVNGCTALVLIRLDSLFESLPLVPSDGGSGIRIRLAFFRNGMFSVFESD